ncbi:MAG: 4Fe-4S dicluster domain-containing protein [Bacteroidetes bacterium]|nr:MAG: 4Fe-4S dicluster domain-containing protein [Bacteroidota bacterium]
MDDKKKKTKISSGRRAFLKSGFLAGSAAALTGIGLNALADDDNHTSDKVKVMTSDGKVVEVDSGTVEKAHSCGMKNPTRKEVREGIPGRKFVMVVDLARCRNALKCQESCNKNHYITGHNAWLKVYNMKESQDTAPYWMPMMCQHCDEPACVTVCPVDATFKRRDGIVLIDNEQCIGCRFCMAACPYSARVFNWNEPDQKELVGKDIEYSPEHAGAPSVKGTVDKCDFCPHMIRMGELPHCVSSCPNDVFLFGDAYEDTVTNGSGKSYQLSKLLKDKSGYRYMDGLGTQPSVFYLPPVDRSDKFEDGLDDYNEFQSVTKP